MNPPVARQPSRFVRGRGRGGGRGGSGSTYRRPYFYFRRNGRTIPVGGANQDGADNGAPRVGTRGAPSNRSRNAGRSAGAQRDKQAALDSTFLRPEHYAAPEDALQVQTIVVDATTTLPCPGWRLYFAQQRNVESLTNTVDLSNKINALEKHFKQNTANYDLGDIQRKGWFTLYPLVITRDEDIKQAWPSILLELQTQPLRTLSIFGAAMHAVVTLAAIDASLSQPVCSRSSYMPRLTRPRKIYARPIGFMAAQLISQITNVEVDNLYCVRGAVTAVGAVQLTASWIAYKCGRCSQEQALKQIGFHPCRPTSCKREDCHAKKGFVEQRSSPHTRLTAVQIIRLVDTNLQAPLLDCDVETLDFLDIELRHDLVDTIFVGQELIVTGVLKIRPLIDSQEYQRNSSFTSHLNSNCTQFYLKAISLTPSERVNHIFNERDMEAITLINSEPDSFKLLVQSLAPEVHGQELVKAGVLLSLFGGAGSQLQDERDINVLLVGDPGIGKSHMLEMCAKISERGTLISGKHGSTLTSNRLNATIQGRSNQMIDSGGLLNSINGHCTIDDIDRLASQQETLLQVMESQIITLPFPSIYATLNTPTTIIATANSMRGHYDHGKLLTENIRINPALLSQFHLVFVLMDKPNKDMDTSLTEHIRSLHAGAKKSANIAARFNMKPKTNNSMNMSLSDDCETANDVNYDLGARLRVTSLEEADLDLLPPILIKKFIAYARQQVKPLLTAEAAEALKNFYNDLRAQKMDDKSCAISTSQLEGLIRLTQARARIDFSSEATEAHVRDVLCIVRHSIADTSVGDYMDTNPATAGASSQSGTVKKFIQMLQLRSNALHRRVFDFDELKDMARHAGISCGVTNLVDIANLQGFLLKKGPNMYEVMED